MKVLSNHHFLEYMNPLATFIAVSLGFFYNKKIRKARGEKPESYQQVAFYISLTLIVLLYLGPFHIIAKHYLFSAHMLQLAITFFIIIPLLIISFPNHLYKGISWNYRFRLTMQMAGHPWLTLIAFNLLFTLYFVPSVFNTLHEYWLLNFLFQLILLIYAFFMWWAILGPTKQINYLKPLSRIAFIFLASMALMPIGFYHLLVLSARYNPYIETEAMFLPILTNIYDQQLAGGILKLIQLSSFIFVMYKIVKAWARQMQEKEGDPLDKNLRVVQGIIIRTNERSNK